MRRHAADPLSPQCCKQDNCARSLSLQDREGRKRVVEECQRPFGRKSNQELLLPKDRLCIAWQCLTPELSRAALRHWRWFNHSASAEAAKRARLERIVRPHQPGFAGFS